MRSFVTAITVASVAVLGLSAQAGAQDFTWSGQLSPGQTLEIRSINGEIRASAAGGPTADVVATKTARRSNPADVRIEAVPHAGGVTVCAIYPAQSGKPLNTCEPGGGGNQSTQNNDTSVNFVIHVPQGVKLVARTVNGDVDGEHLTGDADANTVNGSVRLSTTGRAIANTVNGSITATMGRADFAENASFKTVNGGITLNIGSALNAEINASTMNGTITTDFPMTVSGSFSPRKVQGTVGSGGHKLDLSTVNGSIKLLKSQ